jgi:hypothetical protein
VSSLWFVTLRTLWALTLSYRATVPPQTALKHELRVTTETRARMAMRRQGELVIKAAGGVYGRFERKPAHRVVWERCFGPIEPPSLTVDHVCEVTLCQRPDHLQLVSRSENSRRRQARNSTKSN